MVKAIYAGSFDPVTYGHVDIILRGVKLFDEIIVGVGVNAVKKYTFTLEERISLLKNCIKDLTNVRVMHFSGLLINFAKKNNCTAILRGLRVITDFDYEFQIGLTNMNLNPDIETVFLLTNPKNIFISSSMVKEIAQNGGDITQYVHPVVKRMLHKKFKG